MTVDPAGYEDVKGVAQGKIKSLDETAISVVEVTDEGWHVFDVITGRWNVRETALLHTSLQCPNNAVVLFLVSVS